MSPLELPVIFIGVVASYLLISTFWKPEQAGQPEEVSEASDSLNSDETPLTDWRNLLEVDAGASTEEIRTAYKLQISRYHPDKVATLGEELRVVAERKMKTINSALVEALKARGARDS